MVSRPDRDAVINLIDRYSSDEIGAFDLDEELQEIRDFTTDETVEEAVAWLWGWYDEFIDHRFVGSKAEWDAMQRIKLVLQSDGEVHYEELRRVTWRQPAAAACLAGLAILLILGWSYWIVAPIAGVASMLIGAYGSADQKARHSAAVWPFSSITELLRVRRAVPAFSKRRYRPEIARRRLRSPISEAIIMLPWKLGWLFLSPLVLMVQSLPDRDAIPQIKLQTA